ncbi:UDP-N-acetylmuramoyl-L-alanyl-D-glutamate--2,6-diaminopimelate ligase [Christensenellaceae bacterium OttesenSCG-928-K19]|nr:UDP-N-acetylmuramoyl-L-alanyl-D-glutamate--2,6-diaminopimelate ligase [Christensenellaceae bacterium OttesenSCG-928-K19]
MKLSELLHGIKHTVYGDDTVEISDLSYDSRKVKKGDLFFCISGYATDGHEYAHQAVKSGAAAIVVTKLQEELQIPQVLVKDDRQAMAECAARFFGYPARKMKTVGITGTNGKTTTTYMIRNIAKKAGMKVGLVGTILNMIGDETVQTERTTPESVDLQRLLKRMVEEGCDLLVMEVSSHSLYLKRVYGIEFDVGIFTNLTQDHLDFHKTWDEYVKAKSMLFEQSCISVVNVDDDSAANMISAAKGEVMEYGVMHSTQYSAKHVELKPDGVSYDLEFTAKSLHIDMPIPGMFSVYNSLASAVAALALDIGDYYIEQGLKEMKPVNGRFELLDTRGQQYSIILDYAHTPDSLENTLSTIREFAPGRIVTVFGCGGNRDMGKRPQMGEISARYSDYTVVTSDNPRYEEPKAIMEQIEAGVKERGAKYICIENRKEAMKHAIKTAQKDDIILLAGKGHETYQEIKGVKHDFDEKIVVQEIFDELKIRRR